MTDETGAVVDDAEEVVDDTERDIRVILREMQDDITNIRLDLDAIAGERGAGVEENVEVGEETSSAAHVDAAAHTPHADADDPYLHEKRPVRRHGLFRRIIEG